MFPFARTEPSNPTSKNNCAMADAVKKQNAPPSPTFQVTWRISRMCWSTPTKKHNSDSRGTWSYCCARQQPRRRSTYRLRMRSQGTKQGLHFTHRKSIQHVLHLKFEPKAKPSSADLKWSQRKANKRKPLAVRAKASLKCKNSCTLRSKVFFGKEKRSL